MSEQGRWFYATGSIFGVALTIREISLRLTFSVAAVSNHHRDVFLKKHAQYRAAAQGWGRSREYCGRWERGKA